MKEGICLFGMKTLGLAPQNSASQSGTVLTETDTLTTRHQNSQLYSVKMLQVRSLKLTALCYVMNCDYLTSYSFIQCHCLFTAVCGGIL